MRSKLYRTHREIARAILNITARKQFFTAEDVYIYFFYAAARGAAKRYSLETVSRRLRELREAGFIERVKRGGRTYYVPRKRALEALVLNKIASLNTYVKQTERAKRG